VTRRSITTVSSGSVGIAASCFVPALVREQVCRVGREESPLFATVPISRTNAYAQMVVMVYFSPADIKK
jgi:hypothetical protein